MRIVDRESVPEAKLLRLAGSERPVNIEAVINLNGRVKVSRVLNAEVPNASLWKPRGIRFALLEPMKTDSEQAFPNRRC